MGLILSRRRGERIFVGDGVVVTVADIAHGRVRLDVECDRSVRIFREEAAPPGTREVMERKIQAWKSPPAEFAAGLR